MSVPIIAFLKGWLYEEASLQMDPLLSLYIWIYESLISKLLQKSCGKNMRSVLLYNPSKTQWKNKGSYSWYAVKNTYNPVEQIRRNTFGIYHVFHTSLIKTVMGKIK
jgi:hypothetical protein